MRQQIICRRPRSTFLTRTGNAPGKSAKSQVTVVPSSSGPLAPPVVKYPRHRWNYFNPLPIKEIHDRWIHPHSVGAIDLLARLKRDLEGAEA